MNQIIAGIDVHKRMLMVVIGTVSGSAQEDGSEAAEPIRFASRRFWDHHGGTVAFGGMAATARLLQEAVMESTAQCIGSRYGWRWSSTSL